MKIEITIQGLEPLAEAINNVAQAIKSRETLKEIKAGVYQILDDPQAKEQVREAAQKVQGELFPRRKAGDFSYTRVDRLAERIASRTAKDKKELRQYIYSHHASDIEKRGIYNCIRSEKAKEIEKMLS